MHILHTCHFLCSNYCIVGSGQRYQILLHVARVKKLTAMQESHTNCVLFSHGNEFFTRTVCKICNNNHISQATAAVALPTVCDEKTLSPFHQTAKHISCIFGLHILSYFGKLAYLCRLCIAVHILHILNTYHFGTLCSIHCCVMKKKFSFSLSFHQSLFHQAAKQPSWVRQAASLLDWP